MLAAGLSTRFGGGKHIAEVGPNGEALYDYSVLDAHRTGYRRFVFVIRREAAEEFAAHVTAVWGDDLDHRFTIQEPPDRRPRPWGTGHAVLAARPEVDGAFAVVNADDWYPSRGFAQLADVLTIDRDREYALVTYRLDTTTMSSAGGVSRAICEVTRDGHLHSITEVRDIEPSGDGFVGRGADGEVVVLSGSEPVSMNLWGFRPSVFAILERQFVRFSADYATDEKEEFLLGDVIDHAIRTAACHVRVLDGGRAGFGITFKQDLSAVRQRIASLVAGGQYPARLRDGLR